MQTLLVLAIGLAVPGFQLYVLLRERRARARVWRATARSLGLTGVTGQDSSKALEGARGARRVRFERIERKEHKGTRVIVTSDSGITLQREDWATALGKSLGKAETEIGDPDFDREIYVRGEPAVLRAVLDAETRGAVRGLVIGHTLGVQSLRRGGIDVVGGDIVAELSDLGCGTPELLTEAVETLLGLARRLDRPADLAGRIVENTFREPDSGARLGNVVLLASRYPDHAASREAFKHACRDGNVEVRLRAAVALGEEGRDTLLQIASSQASNESLAARAIAGLGRHLPLERGLEMLGDALRRRHVEAARACLESLGQVGGDAVVAPLARVLAVEDGPLAVAAAEALGESGSPAAEAPLLRAVAQAAFDAGAAAAEALGRVGSAAAVLPLKEAAEAPGADAGLRRAARQAVAEIQSRLSGATPGQLSLADGAAGQLSLADEDAMGRVSFAEPRQRR
jgi:hypothetical protein